MGIAIFSKIIIGLHGQVVFILDEKNAFRLVDLSSDIAVTDRKSGVITEMGLSFVKEVGNIVTSAYLNALSLILQRMIVPPLPTLVSGTIENILSIILSPYGEDDFAYIVEAVFEETQADIKGSFYLILTPEAAKDVRKTCMEILDSHSKDT
jgi:chemotaxis protein CheC